MQKIIGYQGIIGCNSYRLIEKYFPNEFFINYYQLEDLFIALQNNELNHIVLPIRNSITGEIKEHTDLIKKYNCKIIEEKQLDINHCLYGLIDSDLNNIDKIISHPQALLQCSNFTSKYETIETWNTAGALHNMIETKDNKLGCIAPSGIIKENIKVLKEEISNTQNNTTYFAILNK
jgi:prephenate dehydratase